MEMLWNVTHRADRRARKLADAHYSRKTIGGEQFAPPGYALVLLTANAQALWVSSYQQDRYAPYPGWVCSIFRNESAMLSSMLIRQAVAATRYYWGEPPATGMLTFIDASKVRSCNPGYCFKRAGFKQIGTTKRGQIILQMRPEAMPAPVMPNNAQMHLWSA